MYSKEDMMLWSMMNSMVVNIGKIEILAFSPDFLFKVFKNSSEMGINVFKEDYKKVLEIIEVLKEGVEKEKIKNFFGDFKLMKNLKNQIENEKKVMVENEIDVITYFCPGYPNKLRECKNPPFVLYCKGNKLEIHELNSSISIVGTRNPQEEGVVQFTEMLIKDLKNELKYNISGLALGCDTIGHKITLEYGIKNIAVLGQGLGTEIYPKENYGLAQEIVRKGGVLISEIPPSLGVKGVFLLRRNRLQAYLTNELLVLESGKKGGTITTLKAAFLEKRRVYVRNIKINHTMFNMRNITKVTFISSYSDINLIKTLTSKPNTLFTFEFS
ncbi:DNA-protecting protein DprA [Cetobacterium somerae]|uniref:DNA-processing protein DprA n=1 Tax=Cetobacterium sp. NK01 TaxID=2993530 RepID=UPI0021165DF5|nr:DNA-processing protein DprA [Cetobacterium sp. NK01]MCQ8212961.1 DNA-protecting protein DprA [Cetobacterium sp. NK01]